MSKPWSVLILDDDPGVRQSMRLCLEVDGARVLGVGTPAGALDALDHGLFDVVSFDLWLKLSWPSRAPRAGVGGCRAGYTMDTAFVEGVPLGR
jgi:CheY-like chemotaxis protein